jgi:hypothetical protein
MLLNSTPNFVCLAAALREYNDTRRQTVESVGDVQVSQSVLFGKHGN